MPVDVQRAVAIMLGSAVVQAESQPGGFSPGVAARCALADGRRCFVKATSAVPNPFSLEMYRREAEVAARLPPTLPVPQLLALHDDGEWVVLVFEEVDGVHPQLPWTLDALRATFDALDALARVTTPCPVDDLPTFAEQHRYAFRGYRGLLETPGVDGLDSWTRAHLAPLAALEAEWEAAAAGSTLLHSDVRADNLLIRPDGTVVLIDWPFASTGAAWVDKVCMLPSVALDGGPPPWQVVDELEPFGGVADDAVNRVLIGVAGYFTAQGLQDDPPGLPTLRAFQRAQGDVARAWLRERAVV